MQTDSITALIQSTPILAGMNILIIDRYILKHSGDILGIWPYHQFIDFKCSCQQVKAAR